MARVSAECEIARGGFNKSSPPSPAGWRARGTYNVTDSVRRIAYGASVGG